MWPREHHQHSTMRFTSLTTIAISAAAMVGTVIASDSEISPVGRKCTPSNSMQCSRKGLKGYNNGNDYGFFCGPKKKIMQATPCACSGCCTLDASKEDFQCGT
ncbi:uncharacterized protein F5891DRAFT_1041376 [Suillus fuscotomentosus]|uniref:Uncharacterized protein n=1 Tax=Suillus fuscotomentosus TaxID=1912939 RepID=A0AAD4HK35_9AGAM|nr:uncharacterized protein F5891DRAFT_1041376 [Suillus fuscotomentosus]KAG1899081.1 hypothetical protein F5891DRAFT_1041376 [Suillus fuscotomentosus]